MSIESDLLIDRGRLKRRLSVWRVVALLAVLFAVLAVAGRGGGATARDHVARVSVAGAITDDRKQVETIRALADDRSVRAVILSIDSPGGTVSGGQALHAAFAAVAARKPVVAVMGGLAASAGYMIAMPSQRVFAREGTITGSIGVILETAEASGLLAKVGITAEAITSGPLKDQPSPTKPLSDAGRAELRGVVMDLYDQFVGVVAAGRHMTADQVRALADGRVFTGRQALILGLVDQIGGEPEARAWLATQGVPAALPTTDMKKTRLLIQMFDAAFDGELPAMLLSWVGTVTGQGFSGRAPIDGAFAVWQPSGSGH